MRELNDRAGIALVLTNIGSLAKMQNAFDRARPVLEEAIDLSRKADSLYCLEIALSNLAQVATRQGDYSAAGALFHEVLALHAVSRNEPDLIEILEAVAELAACLNRTRAGVRIFSAVASLRERRGMPVVPDERAEYDRRNQVLRAALDEKTFADEWAAGFALTSEDAIAQAIAVTQEDPV